MKNNEAVAYSHHEDKAVTQDLNSENLHTTLPMKELIALFASEIGEIVNFDSFEFENSQAGIHVFDGFLKLHKCSYKIKSSGMDLGQVTLTRRTPFDEEEMIIFERALGALSIHLSNALDYQSELKEEHINALKVETQLSRTE
ncbi:MAG: hypothetical protein IIB77_01740 [Proteobacteria bacterium]|nr:hypothetical protein [Pseudomonadota bacterium]